MATQAPDPSRHWFTPQGRTGLGALCAQELLSRVLLGAPLPLKSRRVGMVDSVREELPGGLLWGAGVCILLLTSLLERWARAAGSLGQPGMEPFFFAKQTSFPPAQTLLSRDPGSGPMGGPLSHSSTQRNPRSWSKILGSRL